MYRYGKFGQNVGKDPWFELVSMNLTNNREAISCNQTKPCFF